MTPNKIVPRYEYAVPFKINGVYCRFVNLTQGAVAIVSVADYERVCHFKWYALRLDGKFYAARKERVLDDGSHRTILMHRYLLGLDFGNPLQGDHADLNPLNNLLTDDHTTTNLRIATSIDNRRNLPMKKTNSCGFKGVRFDKKAAKSNSWSARITVECKTIHLGMFATPELANMAYEKAAKKYFGKFARSK